MPKIGRNDPCYCGSGKKYKHCHLKIEEEAVGHTVRVRRARWSLFAQVVEFGRARRFATDFISAFNLFWDGRRDLQKPEPLTRGDAYRFYDWYIYDYRLSESRKYCVELYLEEKGDTVTPEEKSYLLAWQQPLFSVYQHLGTGDGEKAKLKDILQDLDYIVDDAAFTRGLEENDLVMARLVKTNGDYRFTQFALTLSADSQDRLVEFANDKFAKYKETHFEATWPEFLRESSYLFNHCALDLAGEKEKVEIMVPEAGEIAGSLAMRRFLTGETEEAFAPIERIHVDQNVKRTPSGIVLPK